MAALVWEPALAVQVPMCAVCGGGGAAMCTSVSVKYSCTVVVYWLRAWVRFLMCAHDWLGEGGYGSVLASREGYILNNYDCVRKC